MNGWTESLKPCKALKSKSFQNNLFDLILKSLHMFFKLWSPKGAHRDVQQNVNNSISRYLISSPQSVKTRIWYVVH